MLTWEELKRRDDITGRIDWDITPAQAFEAYQIKSTGAWRNRGLDEAVYFFLSTWQGRGRVLLVRRTYTQSEELAEAPAPAEMVARAMADMDGQDYPRGQLPLNAELRGWLMAELGLV